MALNPNIILSGKIANPLEAMSRGMEVGDAQNTIRRRNALEQAYQQHGEGALAGNPESLNALARLGDFKNPTSIQAHRQDMAFNREEMEFKRAKARRDAADWAKTASEEEAARAEESLSRLLMGAAPFYERGDEAGYNAYLIQNKIDPAQIPFGDFISHAARARGTIEGIKAVRELMAGPKPKTQIVDGQLVTIGQDGATAAPIQGFQPKDTAADEYQRYAQEETAAGRQPLSRIDYAQAKKGNGISMTMPDGTVVRVGGKSGDGGLAPSSPQAMIDSIDGILNDPALDTATGVFSFLQAVPGTPQRRFGARAAQLEGQAFLQAFESLKGGGQITEIEGQKATQAIGRLDTAQSPNDYRQALTELRDLLQLAQNRPPGWAQQQSAKPQEMPTILDEAGYNALPSGTVFIAPDGTQRRKP